MMYWISYCTKTSFSSLLVCWSDCFKPVALRFHIAHPRLSVGSITTEFL